MADVGIPCVHAVSIPPVSPDEESDFDTNNMQHILETDEESLDSADEESDSDADDLQPETEEDVMPDAQTDEAQFKAGFPANLESNTDKQVPFEAIPLSSLHLKPNSFDEEAANDPQVAFLEAVTEEQQNLGAENLSFSTGDLEPEWGAGTNGMASLERNFTQDSVFSRPGPEELFAPKTPQICAKRYLFKDYIQHSTKAKPVYQYFGYEFERNTVTGYTWSYKLTGLSDVRAVTTPVLIYATEHIYEAAQIEDFLLFAAAFKKGLAAKDIPDLVKGAAPSLCKDYIQTEILERSKPKDCRAPIDELMSNLSGVEDKTDPNVAEFFYLAERINNAKLNLMQGKKPGPLTVYNREWKKKFTDNEALKLTNKKDWRQNRIKLYGEYIATRLERAGEWDLVFRYLQNTKVQNIYKSVSKRMLTTLQNVDKDIATANPGRPQPTLIWANGYKEYEKFVTVTWPAAVGAQMNEIFIDPSISDLTKMLAEGKLFITDNKSNPTAVRWWTRQARMLTNLKVELTAQKARVANLTLKNLQLP